MLNLQLAKNIKDLDVKIGKLNKELDKATFEEDDDKYDKTTRRLDELTDLRCKLAESKVNGSVKSAVVSGVLGIASVVVVLKFEQTEIITSKAFNMATSMFRGSK